MQKIILKIKKNIQKIAKKANSIQAVILMGYGIFSTEFKKSFNFGKLSFWQIIIVMFILWLAFVGQLFLTQKIYYAQLIKNLPAVKSIKELREEKLELKVKTLVKGTPIEVMSPYIAKKDKQVAAFLIGIARKESNWGKRKPVLNGQDCFNYWGYRGKSKTLGSGGHTCFANPEEAVNVVAKRIEQIIKNNQAKSARNMIVWKCGYSCAAHNPQSVDKWIKDVDMYAQKILN